jgi:integrase
LDLVFCDRSGGYLAQNTVKYPFQQALRRAGLSPIRFHDLRHTAATLLLSADVHPKVVSEMLGHAGIKITLDVYAHVLPTMQREAARVMGELLGYVTST